MAISNNDGSIILSTKVDTSGIKSGMSSINNLAKTANKTFLALAGAAATSTVAISKMAVSAYAEYEQLVGGVETLFKGSANKVVSYAENAFSTVGLSANEYMQTVTSFSAALISGLSGDTEQAADVANMALTDMADNANKMGTAMQSIQNAYQGFAKQNYMMLDNLKLGYGGTKTEMQRLLKDAQKLTGQKYDISNLSDVYSAIHAIQVQLGITGTTALEAEKTISGSANMMKSAWKNVLTAVGGGGDIDKAMNNLVYSVQVYFNNIVPVVEKSLQGIGTLISKVAPLLVQTVAKSLIKAIPSLLEAVYQLIIGLWKGIYQGIVDLFSGKSQETVKAQSEQIKSSVASQKQLTSEVKKTTKAAKKSLAAFDEVNTLTESIASNLDTDDDSDATIGGVGAASLTETEPDGSKYTQAVSDTLYKIMAIVAPCLLAVGVILLLLGNIPWGLGFIIAGAADFAVIAIAAKTTQIDQEAKERLAEIMQVAGGAAVAIGLLLLFLGQVPWGIGFIVGGAAAFGVSEILLTADPQEIKETLNGVLSFLAGVTAFLITKQLLLHWGTFVKLWGSFRALMSLIKTEGFFNAIIGLFGGSISTITLWAVAIGVIVGSIAYLALNWDKLTPAQRTITILSALAAAATAAAIAIALFHTSWSVGIAAAAIAGGIAILAGTYLFKKNNVTASNALSGGSASVPSDISQYSSMAQGGTFSLPKLATGAVLPPNKPFLAVVGDQKSGTNIEAPLDTIKQAVAEVFATSNAGGGYGGRIEVPVIINGREIARAVREAESDMGNQTVFGGFANAY